jgi:hypothetical protein
VRERFDLEVDITRALNDQAGDSENAALKLVAVDASGREVEADRLILEEVVVEVE